MGTDSRTGVDTVDTAGPVGVSTHGPQVDPPGAGSSGSTLTRVTRQSGPPVWWSDPVSSTGSGPGKLTSEDKRVGGVGSLRFD